MKKKYLISVLFVALLVFSIAGIRAYYNNDKASLTKADITVKIAYAYIGHQTLNNDVTGLNYEVNGKNASNSLVSYIVVLKITNQATEMASLTDFRVYVAPEIVYNSVGFNQSNGQPAPGGLGSPSLEIRDALISDVRVQSYGGYSNYLSADQSRLIALTGVISLDKFSEEDLQNGTLYIYGAATAHAGYADWQTAKAAEGQIAHDLQHVTFTNVNGDYLFNNLLDKNEILLIDGLDARVQLNP